MLFARVIWEQKKVQLSQEDARTYPKWGLNAAPSRAPVWKKQKSLWQLFGHYYLGLALNILKNWELW
jgi:hypothetical protein